jgi:type VI protein secretion system component VasK
MYAVLAAFPLLFAWLWLTGRHALALLATVAAIIVATLIDRVLDAAAGPVLPELLKNAVPIAMVALVLIVILPLARRAGWIKDKEVQRLSGRDREQPRGQDAHHKQEE